MSFEVQFVYASGDEVEERSFESFDDAQSLALQLVDLPQAASSHASVKITENGDTVWERVRS